MARGISDFLKGLKVENGETSQIEVAEEAIRKELFIIMPELNLENGQTVKMSKVVGMISDKLGINSNKMQIAEIIIQAFQTGHYSYKIDDKGNIEACFSRADILQKQYENKMHEEAEEILHKFVQQANEYANELLRQKTPISVANLQAMFSEEELQQNHIWIDLAISHVLEKQNQER